MSTAPRLAATRAQKKSVTHAPRISGPAADEPPIPLRNELHPVLKNAGLSRATLAMIAHHVGESEADLEQSLVQHTQTEPVSIGTFVKHHLQKQALTVRAFAQQVGVSHVFVCRVTAGHSKLPPDQFAPWCEALRLTKKEQENFLQVSFIRESIPALRFYVAALESTIDHRATANKQT